MYQPVSIYLLKPILDEDSRFDGFIIAPGASSVLGCKDPILDFHVDDGESLDWKPRSLAAVWKPLTVKGVRAPVKLFNDYPCLDLSNPVFSRRAVEALGEMLTENGELLPLKTDVGEYYSYVVLTKLDALDLNRSQLLLSDPTKPAGWIEYFAFEPSKLTGAAIFRIREQPNLYLVTDAFKKRAEEAALNGLTFIKVWPLPEGSDWSVDEAIRRRNSKPIKLVGQAITLRLFFERELPSPEERERAESVRDSLAEFLRTKTVEEKYWGAVEPTEYADGEYRIPCTCPDCDELHEHLRNWLASLPWENSVTLVKRYGNLYQPRAKQKEVVVRKGTQRARKLKDVRDKAAESNRSSQDTESNRPSSTISEMPADLLTQIKESAKDTMALLSLKTSSTSKAVVEAIDQFVYQWQSGRRDTLRCDAEDLPYLLGGLWGETLSRELGWQWKTVTFNDGGEEKAPAIVSPEDSLVIYPIHFIVGCLQDSSVDVTILLSYNMLKEGRMPQMSPGSLGNVMKMVHRIVPRAIR